MIAITTSPNGDVKNATAAPNAVVSAVAIPHIAFQATVAAVIAACAAASAIFAAVAVAMLNACFPSAATLWPALMTKSFAYKAVRYIVSALSVSFAAMFPRRAVCIAFSAPMTPPDCWINESSSVTFHAAKNAAIIPAINCISPG